MELPIAAKRWAVRAWSREGPPLAYVCHHHGSDAHGRDSPAQLCYVPPDPTRLLPGGYVISP
ncbi:hypothetical protein DPMN_070634 [Dreissena polymorpha]|uniref:Uncharacterized protein n=1 Tax=Dreissena polymorpha TaxID=45954 RepID=A0A9D3Z6J3_DREPO|nr:hypothetical protein DPMN_070634 [Dreissena polymorpha]